MESRISHLSNDNMKLQQVSESENGLRGKVEEYENKLALISLELERLNNNIKVKTGEKVEADR